MSSKLLKKQLAALHSQDKQGPSAASTGIIKRKEEASKHQKLEKALRRAAQSKDEIKKRNLEFFAQTKRTQEATVELMNKVRHVALVLWCHGLPAVVQHTDTSLPAAARLLAFVLQLLGLPTTAQDDADDDIIDL